MTPERALVRSAAALATAAVAVQYVPSVAVLGQWTGLRVLPGELCRWQGPVGRRQVALTFDDGPHPTGTPAVLDRLDQLDLRATFFPLASLAEGDPNALAEVVRRGHGLGTHGFEHDHHLRRGPGWIRRDLAAADEAMGRIGYQPVWYRPTYGQVTGVTLMTAKARGWRTVLWSAWGREWATDDPKEVAARIALRLTPGAVVLLHDSDANGPPGMWEVVTEGLGHIADELHRRDLSAVTMDELVA